MEGFSTRISGSYAVTGRLAEDGVRRLKQNLRQLLDIFMPRGVEPSGEGWRVTLHIRLVHAKARMLLAGTDEWNGDEWGVPVSAAHVAMGAAALSARLIELAATLGADLDRSDREGIMAVWSCAAHVIGVPDALIFRNQEEGLRLFRVAAACEPPPDADAVAMAASIIDSVPAAIGITAPKTRADTKRRLYRVSRELLGDERADRLGFPAASPLPLLPWLRARGRITRWLLGFFPGTSKARDREAFMRLLRIADLGEPRASYDLPDHIGS